MASKVTTVSQTNTADFVFDNAAKRPRHVALRRRAGGVWADVSGEQFAGEVAAVAKGLIAAGIAAGDRVAVMSKTRYEWTIVDFALFTVGAVVVPIYETSSAEQVQWILSDSGAGGIFVETPEHADIVESVRGETPDLAHVWQFESGAIAELNAAGDGVTDADVTARRGAVGLDDLASIIYTSGTTGRPKGCELTHRCFITEAVELLDLLDDFFNADTSTLLFLPIAHVFGRAIEIGALAAGCTLGHTADVKNLLERPRWLQAHVRARGPARLREGLQHARSSRPTPAARDGSSTAPRRWRSRTPRPPRRGRRRCCSSCSTPSSTGWSTAGCGRHSAATASRPSPAGPRSARASGTSSAASA